MYLKTIWSVTDAHISLSVNGARYFFSHITCIASSLASMSGRPSPLFSLGCVTSVQFINGLLSSHMKDFICLVILWTMFFGISFAVARYNALDWIRAFRISSLSFDNKLVFDYFFSILDCLLRIFSHCTLISLSFPICAPRVLSESLSSMILIA